MELSTVPQTIAGWVVMLLAGLASVSYLWSRVRANDLNILRATNQDQGDRIRLLESAVVRLETQVHDLIKQNKTLEDLVAMALKQYFFEHPDIAKGLQEKILK